MINYEVTIGYKAVITVSVKAENEGEAKQLALKKFETSKDKIVNKAVFIQNDSYKAGGCLDMDATWNTINN